MLMLYKFTYLLQSYSPVAAAIIFVWGAIIGSFLNVCIVRLPEEGESIVKPGSHCLKCRKPIRWYDNIPLLSYIFLRGRCRWCHARIPFRYFAVELLTALLFVALYYVFGISFAFVIYAYFACSLVVVSFVDLEHQIIPDEVTLGGILVGLIASYAYPELQGETIRRLGIADSILGVLLGGGLVYLMAVLGHVFFKKQGMGGGDAKLLGMIGAFTGPAGAAMAFFAAAFFAVPTALYSFIRRRGSVIPYGPYLSMGGMLVVVAGDKLLELFIRFLL